MWSNWRLYDNFNTSAPAGFADPSNQAVANTPLAIVRCPSNPVTTGPIKMRKSSTTGTAYGAYITATGTTTDPTDPTIMTGWASDYWVTKGINASSWASISSAPVPDVVLKTPNPRISQVTDGLSNTTMLLEHAGYDVHYVTGVGTPMNMSTDLTLDQPGAWGTWVGWCGFTIQGYPTYTPATYPPIYRTFHRARLRPSIATIPRGFMGSIPEVRTLPWGTQVSGSFPPVFLCKPCFSWSRGTVARCWEMTPLNNKNNTRGRGLRASAIGIFAIVVTVARWFVSINREI